MEEHWPEEIKLRPNTKLIPAIPKLHELMHQPTGHQVYSLNYIKGCGHSDCECPKHVWGPHNPLANSTKTQGPGTRHDVFDDHFSFWNWLKYIGLGLTLLWRYKAAMAQQNLHKEAHRGLTESLDPELVEVMGDNIHLLELEGKKQLAEEEERRLADGGISLHATSAASFVQMGLDLEDTQRRLQRLSKAMASKSSGAIGQERSLTEEQNTLCIRLRAWEQLVPIYMPGLLQYQMDQSTHASSAQALPKSEKPEDADIWLPSRLPSANCECICCLGVAGMEERLRDAQCTDSINKVCCVLKLKARMIHFKNKNVRGQ
ncbi:hypothetical protein BDZ97DRAFT_1906427 [Flammula alnicola]|nr:hypothetical protein BDZ97DRAFT_1906427 [Flammula alnicola]